MSERDVAVLLEDIRQAMGKIERYCSGMDRDSFLTDDKTADAVVRNIGISDEAVKQLPADFKDQRPGVPWNQIAGLRNRIVHDYAGIDLEIIWEVAQGSLPKFREQIDSFT